MLLLLGAATAQAQSTGAALQALIDAAPDHGVVNADPNAPLVLSTPLVIRKPLTLTGLNAELPAGLGKTPLLVIESDGVAVTDIALRGNADSVDQKDRNALLEVRASEFRIERARFLNSAKDGIMIDGGGVPDRDIVGGVIRDIYGKGNVRDLVSIGGGGAHGRRIRHVLVDNVRAFDSEKRGAVEVSDGTEHITVRNVYAENCVYAVDVQDHGKPLQINTNVRIEGVTAVDSTHIVRTANKPHGHAGLTIRDATGIRCAFPLKISNTADVTIENVRISEQPAGTDSALWIINVDGFTLRDAVIRPGDAATPAIRLYDTNDARIENLHRHDGAMRPAHGVVVKISKGVTASGFRIHNSVFGPSTGAGILLEKEDDTAQLTGIYVVGNVATVENHFDDEDAEIDDNVDPVPARGAAVAGTTWTRHTIDDTSEGADGTRLADFDGDGRLDIATPWEQGGVVRVYANPGPQGARAAWPQVTVGRVKSPEDAVLHDLDGDGAPDVVSSAEGDERALFIHWAPTDGAQRRDETKWTTTAIPESAGRQWLYAAPAQMDGRHGPDLVAAGKNDEAWIGWFEAPADPRDGAGWRWYPLRKAGWVMSIVNIDMDGDGDLDILYSDRKGESRGVWWLEHPGAEGVTGEWKHHAIGGLNREAMFLDTGDIDGDGQFDIAAAVRDGGILRFTRGATDLPWTEREIPLPADAGVAKSVTIADVNGDGRSDLVVSAVESKGKHGVFWLDGGEGANWTAHAVSGSPGTKFDRVEALDLDGDGDLDLISSEETEQLGVFWYENPQIKTTDDEEGPPVSPLAGTRFVPEDVDWAHPVYTTSFDDPNELTQWKLEGGKRAAIEDGNLILESTPPVEGEESDHLVFWRDQVFPADFLLEFTFRPQSREKGLAIVFFNARGIQGEGIFEPVLKPRHGVFKQYHSSDLNCYHISYWAGARGTANIRKNAGFNLVATGPDLVSPGPAGEFQKIRVYKKGGLIRLIIDDVISAAWDDDGTIGGPIHTHDGWIGLRQMEHAVRGEYGEFAVYPLKP